MIIIMNYKLFQELQQWEQWEENPVVVVADKPIDPIQAKIQQYRQQFAKPPENQDEENQYNFFEVKLFSCPNLHFSTFVTSNLIVYLQLICSLFTGHDAENYCPKENYTEKQSK